MKIINKVYSLIASDSIHLKKGENDVKAWEEFINSLPDRNDSVSKAHNKYMCRMYFFSQPKQIALNILGLMCMVIDFTCLLFSTWERSREINDIIVLERNSDVDFKDVIPLTIADGYSEMKIVDNIDIKFGAVSKESRRYVLQCIKKYPFQFFFHFLIYKELLTHDHLINQYMPRAVAVYVNERNVASPILKEVYTTSKRRFISFMHGEYLLNLIQGYMAFTDYYVWDEAYIDSFAAFLKCDIDQYHIYTPQKLNKKWNLELVDPQYSFTYYFSNERKTELAVIAKLFSALNDKGIKCKVRPHPRFMQNISEMADKFGAVLIEDPHAVSLETSLANTEYAVGLATTVLSEAEAEGRKIVIDDVSNHALFEDLRNRRYRILSHEHLLLSELIKPFGIDKNDFSE